MSDPIRVLIADDSATARHLLASLCRRDAQLLVVGEARDGGEAVAMALRLRPDIVVMDLHMPVLDGFAATRLIMERHPTPVLVVTASVTARDVALAMRSMEAGAVGVVQKPAGPDDTSVEHGCGAFLRKVKALAGVRVIRRFEGRRPEPPHIPVEMERSARRVVGVATSTGGPVALRSLLQALPAEFPAPLMVVQHIAAGFLPGFVTWLGHDLPLPVSIAAHGERYLPGRVYLAPDDQHLKVGAARRLTLDHSAPVAGFRPSASVLFSSLAQVHGSAAVGVVLTGLGSDGLVGIREVHEAGGCVLAQDPETAVAPSMPGTVVRANVADVVAPVGDLAAHLVELCTSPEG